MSGLHPPAQVRTAKSEIMACAKKIIEGMKSRDKLNLQDAISLGKLIVRLKAECGVGEYLPALKNIGLTRQRASEYRRIAEKRPAELKGCDSIADALETLPPVPPEEENSAPPQEGMSGAGHTGQNGSVYPRPKLIPELALWPAGFSPKILPRIEALPEWKQASLAASLREGQNIVTALGSAEDLPDAPPEEFLDPLVPQPVAITAAPYSPPNLPDLVTCPTCKGKGEVPEDKLAKLKFVPPSVEEVRAYCQERKNSVDPEVFCDFYTAKGWKVGTAAMKDWRASVRTWEKNRESTNGHARAGKAPQRQNDRWEGPDE